MPQKIQRALDKFADELKKIYRDGLISVILYGSYASGEFKSGFSNINLLIILDDTSLKNLARSAFLFKKSDFRYFNCLFFTPDYINRSTDVFPIEFLDIKENFVIIYGKDLLSGLKIDLKNLRFQCEQELKAKLLNIQAFFLHSRDKTALQNLLVKTFNSFLHISRNLIRLKGKNPAYQKEEILAELAVGLELDVSGLKKIFDLKNKRLKLNYRESEELLFNFVRTLEATIKVVDES